MKEPNKIQTVLSVASCKLTRTILRRTGRGGTALPGTVAMKVSKNILSVPAKDMEIVVVTGTNGKTTTCNMIEHALTEGGHDCHRDKSGANLLHGQTCSTASRQTFSATPTGSESPGITTPSWRSTKPHSNSSFP